MPDFSLRITKQGLLFIFLLTLSFNGVSQKKRVARLPNHLKEISGLTFLNDSILVAHNDGGHEAILYFLNLKGEEIHSVNVSNATNMDWEDITTDGKGTLFVADIGNNENKRTDLCIYKISDREILSKESVTAEVISYHYPDQTAFPPVQTGLYYDAEAIAFYQDSLYIYTKCRTVPWDGLSFCYTLPVQAGNYAAKKHTALLIGKKGWPFDSVTAAEMTGDKCYLLTYDRVISYLIRADGRLTFEDASFLFGIRQYEAIAVNSKGEMYIANEKRKFRGGPDLYILK